MHLPLYKYNVRFVTINHSPMNNLIRFILCFLLLCNTGKVFAQLRYDAVRYNEDDARIDTANTDGGRVNDCAEYYYHPGDSNAVVFKSATETTYESADSNMTDKKVSGKIVNFYNKIGLLLFKETIDEKGVVSDSTRNVYDVHNHQIREMEYERNDKEKMKKTMDESWLLDAKGNALKHISMNIDADDNSVDKTTEYNTYDTAGNVIKNITYEDEGTGAEDRDTTVTFSKYDAHRRLIYSESKNEGILTRNYTTYNEQGMEVFSASASTNDSNATITSYDNDYRIKEQNKNDNGKLSETLSTKFDNDSNRIETKEKLSTSSASSCANNTVTVTVYGHNSYLVLSEVISRQKDGKPFVTKTNDKYTIIKGKLYDVTLPMVSEPCAHL